MMACTECGATRWSVARENYEYRSLPGVILEQVEVRTCAQCGESEVVIPNLTGLNRVLVEVLAKHPLPLSAPQFRFLRKTLGWSREDTATQLGVHVDAVERWESGDSEIPLEVDRALRRHASEDAPLEAYSAQPGRASLTPRKRASSSVRVKRVGNDWTEAAA